MPVAGQLGNVARAGVTRWLGVGVSGLVDARCAAAAAARDAVAGRRPGLVWVSASGDRDPTALAAGVGEVAGGVPMIGGSGVGEICGQGSSTGRVLVVALGGSGFTVATGCGVVGEVGLSGAGEQAASCVGTISDRPHQVLVVLTDAGTGDQQEVLRGAYRVAGAGVPLVGGSCPAPEEAGSGWQLHDGQVRHGAVVAAAIGSDAPFGVGVGHGWEPVGEAMMVTASSGNVVHELDDQAALSRYLQRLSVVAGAGCAAAWGTPDWDAAGFARAAMNHPLGLRRRSGALIRSVVYAEPATGSLVCAAEVPQGAVVWLMDGTAASVLAGVDVACAQARAVLGTVTPTGLLVFDCLARPWILNDTGVSNDFGTGTGGVQQEAVRFTEHAAGAPFAGVYTAGEIARTHGLSGFHNKTVVVLAVG